MWSADISPQFVAFHPFHRVFHKVKFLILMRSTCQYFLLWIMLLVPSLWTPHLTLGPKEFLLCFFSKCFIVLHFTFKSTIPFKLMFNKMWGLDQVLLFFFFFCLWVSNCCSIIHSWKRLIFLYWIDFAKISWAEDVLEIYCTLTYMSIPLPI